MKEKEENEEKEEKKKKFASCMSMKNYMQYLHDIYIGKQVYTGREIFHCLCWKINDLFSDLQFPL